jgi:hypothetical protein
MADVSDPATPKITTAASATVVNDSQDRRNCSCGCATDAKHETVAGQPQQYNISTLPPPIMPLSLSQQSDVHLGRMDTAIYALPMRAVRARTTAPTPSDS